MTRRILIPVLLLALLSLPVRAMEPEEASVIFRELSVRYVDGGTGVRVSFVLDCRDDAVASDDALLVTPIYKGSDGRSHRLPSIRLNGRRCRSYYERERLFAGCDSCAEHAPLLLATLGGRRDGRRRTLAYDYTYRLSSPESGSGEVTLEQAVEDCCDRRVVAGKTFAVERERERVTPRPVITEAHVTFITPPAEVEKVREERITVRIKYPADKDDVRPAFADNASELDRADRAIRPLTDNAGDYRVRLAAIRGYASPEAPYDYNLRLSQRRAEGFRDYLSRRYGTSRIPSFDVRGMGEDWDGLRTLVAASGLPERDEVLHLIDSCRLSEGREQKLTALHDGRTYRYLLDHLYPSLRRIELTLEYAVRPFAPDEWADLFRTRPQDLSLREIYDLARAPKGPGLRALYVAAELFPDDPAALINASSAALLQGDLDLARRCLSRVKDRPRALNNLGVYYRLTGDERRARECFLRAPREDAAAAELNLREMDGAAAAH